VAAREALDAIEPNGAISTAAELARALFQQHSVDERRAALERLEQRSREASALARGALHLMTLADSGDAPPDPTGLCASAERWAEVDPNPVAAIEWVGAAMALGDRE